MAVKKIKNAFSLLELSIVLLVVGLLITGILKGQDVYNETRLVAARQITDDSVVPAIDGLTLWLDATRVASFDNADIEDGNSVQNWHSIVPTSNQKITLSQSDSGKRPTYILNGINGLPVLNINKDGSNDDFISTSSLEDFTEYSAFILLKQNNSGISSTIISKTNGNLNAGANIHLDIHSSNLYRFCDGANCPNGSAISDITKPKILTLIFDIDRNVGEQFSLYINSSLYAARGDAATALVQGGGDFIVGCTTATASGGCNNLDFAEIIIFDRALKNNEKVLVEKYLSKKYGIELDS